MVLTDTSRQLAFGASVPQDARNGALFRNPAWTRVKPNRMVKLQGKLATGLFKGFVLTAVVANVAQQESITKVAQR
jgi:hypothetical protein